MKITATEAKNRLEQRQGVFITAAHFDELESMTLVPHLRSAAPRAAAEFYERHKAWFDEQNRHFEEHGIWNEELRTW